MAAATFLSTVKLDSQLRRQASYTRCRTFQSNPIVPFISEILPPYFRHISKLSLKLIKMGRSCCFDEMVKWKQDPPFASDKLLTNWLNDSLQFNSADDV